MLTFQTRPPLFKNVANHVLSFYRIGNNNNNNNNSFWSQRNYMFKKHNDTARTKRSGKRLEKEKS